MYKRQTVPGIGDTAVTGVYVGLRVAAGRSTASARPYVSIEVVPGQPIALPLTAAGDTLQVFPAPIAIDDLAAPSVITFNLAAGYTPDSLCLRDKRVLDPDALLDIHVIWFLTGRAIP